MCHPVSPLSPLRLLQRCVRAAARTVDAALDPTDVPASTVSLARSAREVRGRRRFRVDSVWCDFPQQSHQFLMLRLRFDGGGGHQSLFMKPHIPEEED